jgi:hypothetical protein
MLLCVYFLRSRLNRTSLGSSLCGRIRRKATCASKSSSTTNALCKCLDHLHFRVVDALEDQLSNTVADFDLEILLREVEEDYFDRAAVVGVDYACASVDAVLSSEAGAGSDTAVCS